MNFEPEDTAYSAAMDRYIRLTVGYGIATIVFLACGMSIAIPQGPGLEGAGVFMKETAQLLSLIAAVVTGGLTVWWFISYVYYDTWPDRFY